MVSRPLQQPARLHFERWDDQSIDVVRRSGRDDLKSALAYKVDFRIVSESLVLLRKDSAFTHAGLQRGMPMDIGGEAWPQWCALLVRATDAFVFDQHGDKGSSNMPTFRHFASIVDEMPSAFCDISCCELHVVQGIKNCLEDTRKHVGRMFSLSRVYKVSSFHSIWLGCCRTTATVRFVVWLAHGQQTKQMIYASCWTRCLACRPRTISEEAIPQ